MKKKLWDLYAPVYERAMRSDRRTYEKMYERIGERVAGKDVLEVATGPGLLAKHVAGNARSMIATDYSEGMIKQAKKGDYPSNLTFEVADATALPYGDRSFDIVLIANALHIMPDPDAALREVRRVLRPGGTLICPNFINHDVSKLWSGILRLAGIKFEHQWTGEQYLGYLRSQGWRVLYSEYLAARISLLYAECASE